jgi:hypothetical protein
MVNEESTSEAPKKRHRQDESEWMATHQAELNAHRGEWVVIEGSQMVAADPDYLTARNRATAAGIRVALGSRSSFRCQGTTFRLSECELFNSIRANHSL